MRVLGVALLLLGESFGSAWAHPPREKCEAVLERYRRIDQIGDASDPSRAVTTGIWIIMRQVFGPVSQALTGAARSLPPSRVRRLADTARDRYEIFGPVPYFIEVFQVGDIADSTVVEEALWGRRRSIGGARLRPKLVRLLDDWHDEDVDNFAGMMGDVFYNTKVFVRSVDFFRATGVFPEFLWTNFNSAPEVADLGHLLLPVGEYGPELTRRLIRTNQVLMGLAVRRLRGVAAGTFERFREVMLNETARGGEPFGELESGRRPIQTIVEGLLSISQAVAQLTAQRLTGVGDYRQAVREVLQPNPDRLFGPVVEYAQRVSIGLLGPLTFSGRFFRRPLRKTKDGFRLGRGLVKTLKLIRREQWDLLAEEWRKTGERPKGYFGLGCPMAGAPAGEKPILQEFADVYLRVFEALDTR